jgi:hypothetical protein
MPYEIHPEIVTPHDETVLWRYMDFAKFVQLIDTKSLWLSRQDQFEDPLEGTLTDGELQQLRAFQDSIATPFLDRYQDVSSFLRRPVFVSCWRSGHHESMAMWDLYGKGSGIVAVKTTVALLKKALTDFTRPVYIATVNYIDWSQGTGTNNILVRCTRKDISYQHEEEVRALMWGHDFLHAPSPQETEPTSEAIPVGMPVPFEAKRFLTEVVVGPREPGWVLPLVTSVMKMYGLPQPVSVSNRLTPRE